MQHNFDKMLTTVLVICSLFLGIQSLPVNRTAGGTFGVDVHTNTSGSTFSCLKRKGFDFAIIRAASECMFISLFIYLFIYLFSQRFLKREREREQYMQFFFIS